MRRAWLVQKSSIRRYVSMNSCLALRQYRGPWQFGTFPEQACSTFAPEISSTIRVLRPIQLSYPSPWTYKIRGRQSECSRKRKRNQHRDSILKNGEIGAGDHSPPLVTKVTSLVEVSVSPRHLCGREIGSHYFGRSAVALRGGQFMRDIAGSILVNSD